MAIKFQDYYETLGVARDAKKEDIQRAFRKLARKYHPDVNKEKGAEDKFKQINEANEVLSDPQKRAQYDALGANWKAGQEFRPPPGWEGGARSAHGHSAQEFDMSGFSDFFEAFFGGAGAGMSSRGGKASRSFSFGGFGEGANFGMSEPEPQNTEATLTITVEDAYREATKEISLEHIEYDSAGRPHSKTRNFRVKIPAGTTEGSTIRMAGQGVAMPNGAKGDLLLKIKLAPHPYFRVSGYDVTSDLRLAPWEAALGAKVSVHSLDGEIKLTVRPGTQNGQRLRLRGKGLPKGSGEAGDMYAEVRILIPETLSDSEKELLEKLASVSRFNPRAAA